jgi:hypothetical protein
MHTTGFFSANLDFESKVVRELMRLQHFYQVEVVSGTA